MHSYLCLFFLLIFYALCVVFILLSWPNFLSNIFFCTLDPSNSSELRLFSLPLDSLLSTFIAKKKINISIYKAQHIELCSAHHDL